MSAPKMYTKDKSNRITLRLNDNQFCFVRANAEALDVSPSDFLRMVINLAMVNSRKATTQLAEEMKATKEGAGRENDEADFNHQL